MDYIKNVKGRQVLDSRGNPTIEVDIITSNNNTGSCIIPSGASRGKYEAIELRDNDLNYFNGKSVLKSVNYINNIISESLYNIDIYDQNKIDNILLSLDNSTNKGTLGGNTILGVSLASIRAAANSCKKPLFQYINNNSDTIPIPMVNIINGGQHANNLLSLQEFMIIPHKAKKFSEALHMVFNVFNNLKLLLHHEGYSTNVGDEGGFAPNIDSNETAIELILKSIKNSNYCSEKDISIAIDAASSSFYNKKVYKLNNEYIQLNDMINYWVYLCNKYPIISLEDPLYEDDWNGWSLLNKKLGSKVKIVGDDLFVTNSKRLQIGLEYNSANAIIIKPNQIGTFSETKEVIDMAHLNKYDCIMSHRSGDSEDFIISDLSVGFKCKYIKTGSLSRSERISKYNQLLRIEEYLGNNANYAANKI